MRLGAGIMTEGRLLHGMRHPEAGHSLLSRLEGDSGESSCPYHKNCFEGLACGPAVKIRFGKEAKYLVNVQLDELSFI